MHWGSAILIARRMNSDERRLDNDVWRIGQGWNRITDTRIFGPLLYFALHTWNELVRS